MLVYEKSNQLFSSRPVPRDVEMCRVVVPVVVPVVVRLRTSLQSRLEPILEIEELRLFSFPSE